MRRLGIFLVAFGAVGAVWLYAVGSDTEADAVGRGAAEGLLVETFVAERAAGYEAVEAHAGRVVARRNSPLGFDLPGRVVAVSVEEGDRVEEGAVLAERERDELAAERTALAAQIEELGARLALAAKTTKRRRELHSGRHLSPEDLDRAVFEEDALEAQLTAARARLQAMDVRLEKTRLRAPYAGRVVARLVDEGTVVAAGQPIVEILEDGALEVRVGVPPDTAARLEEGTRYDVSIGDRSLEGVLRTVLPRVDPATRTRTAIFELDGALPSIASGEIVHLRLPTQVDVEGFWMPLSALTESRRGLWAVYGIDDESGEPRVGRREVALLHAEAERAFVSGTLRNGERIIRAGTHRLVPGQRVRVAP